jgi:hypothetical protein
MKFRCVLSVLVLLATTSVYAGEYFLEIEQSCTTTGNKIAFKCEIKSEKVSIFVQNGKWFGRNAGSDNLWQLDVLKEDQNILVLDNPVFFSGKSIIYLMKPTRRFYWSEFAYSGVLKEQEGTVRYGRVLEINR